jgi:HSP20 family protein
MTFYSPMNRVEHVLNDFFKSPWRATSEGENDSVFAPRISFKEMDDHYQLAVEVPGVKKEDVEISFRGDQLVIKGERKDEQKRKEDGYYYEEFTQGSFSRIVTLPKDVDKEKVSAELDHGLLKIDLAKNDRSKLDSKKILIK